MSLFLSQILNGFAIGQIYVLIALGFCLISGVANIINFAQGSLFMLGAFIAFTGVSAGLPVAAAALVSIALVTLLGLVLERVALRPLVGAAFIAPFLSTLAISVMADQAAELIWSPDSQPFPSLWSDRTFFVGKAYITGTDAAIFLFGLAATAALYVYLNATWLGRALRATAQDPDAAAQLGVRTGEVRQIAFGLAGALGALGGILAAFYFQSVFPQMGVPFGLKGFAAAMIGGLSSVPGAVVGGLLLGIVEALASGYVGSEYRDAIAFGLLLAVLVLRPRGLLGKRTLDALGGQSGAAGAIPTTSLLAVTASARGVHRVLSLPPTGLLAAGALLALLPVLIASPYLLQAATYGLIFALLSASVSLYSGSAGLLSLGHAAFFGIGAYAVALTAGPYGLPLEATLVIAAVATAAAAALITLPLQRLTTDTIALGTLAVGQIGFLTFLNWMSLTRGPMGISGIPQPYSVLLDNLAIAGPRARFWLVLALVTLALLVAERLVSSDLGRAWRAIREDRLAATAAGLPVRRHLVEAAMVSGALAGLAGGLFAYVQTLVSPESFNVQTSILILTMAVLGGLGNLTGAAVAGFALAVVPELLRGFSDYRMIVYGGLLLVALRVRPQGLLGAR